MWLAAYAPTARNAAATPTSSSVVRFQLKRRSRMENPSARTTDAEPSIAGQSVVPLATPVALAALTRSMRPNTSVSPDTRSNGPSTRFTWQTSVVSGPAGALRVAGGFASTST